METGFPRRRLCAAVVRPEPWRLPNEASSSEAVPLPDDLELLRELGRAEATAIRHLERSNTELFAELQVAEDADFRAAIEENCAVLQRKYALLAEISERVGLGLLLRTRLCVAERACGASQGSARGEPGALHCEGAPEAASHTVPGVTGAGCGDDAATTLTRMQTLLRQVKRKASELEDDLMTSELGHLTLSASWERKAARSAEEVGGTDDGGSISDVPGHFSWPCLKPCAPGCSNQPGDVGNERSEGMLLHVPQVTDAGPATAKAVERLGALLRGVKRKAAELEEDVVAGSLRELSLSEQPALDSSLGPEPDARRRELAHRPRIRPKAAATL